MSSPEPLATVPDLLLVRDVLVSRYRDNKRPLFWDQRVRGNDLIRASDGRVVNLLSDGGQSPPKPGWKIVVTGGSSDRGYTWTLYSV